MIGGFTGLNLTNKRPQEAAWRHVPANSFCVVWRAARPLGRRRQDLLGRRPPGACGRRPGAGRGLRPAAPARRRLPDARPRDRRADQRQPHDPALARGPAAPPSRRCERIAEYSVGLMGRTPDYMNVTYRGLCRPAPTNGRSTATRRAPRTWSPTRRSLRRERHLAHPHDRSSDRRPGQGRGTRSVTIRCSCTRSARPRTASSCAARACWRRWRRSPTSSRSIPRPACPTRRPTLRAVASASRWTRRA